MSASYNRDPQVQSRRAELALKIIATAKECNGVSFGGFVRDWVVRKQRFNDLDVWFRERKHADQFIKLLAQDEENKLCANPLQNPSREASWITDRKAPTEFVPQARDEFLNYPFDRMKIAVLNGKYGDPYGVFVDVVVSSCFPVNDFSCNLLCYDGIRITGGTKDVDVDSLVQEVRLGKTKILPIYLDKVLKREGIARGRTAKLVAAVSPLKTSRPGSRIRFSTCLELQFAHCITCILIQTFHSPATITCSIEH